MDLRPTSAILAGSCLAASGIARAADRASEARSLLEQFVKPGADPAALSARLRPTKADYDAVFLPEAAADRFPGGYQRVARHLRPGVTLYAFKFVAPGRSLGMASDGLVHVNGHWRLFPKPFRVLE